MGRIHVPRNQGPRDSSLMMLRAIDAADRCDAPALTLLALMRAMRLHQRTAKGIGSIGSPAGRKASGSGRLMLAYGSP